MHIYTGCIYTIILQFHDTLAAKAVCKVYAPRCFSYITLCSLSIMLLQFIINHIAKMMKNNFSAQESTQKAVASTLKVTQLVECCLTQLLFQPQTTELQWSALQQEEQAVLHIACVYGRGRIGIWKCLTQATPLHCTSLNNTLKLFPRRTFKM